MQANPRLPHALFILLTLVVPAMIPQVKSPSTIVLSRLCVRCPCKVSVNQDLGLSLQVSAAFLPPDLGLAPPATYAGFVLRLMIG